MLARKSRGGAAERISPQPNQLKQAGNGKKRQPQTRLSSRPRQESRVVVNSVPAAVSAHFETSEPAIRTTKHSTRIHHRELLGSVAGNMTFSVQNSYILNPGVAATFPWLSTQASGWEQFHFRKLEFHYIPRCATTKVGSVLLAPDYDSSDPAPSSEIIAAAYRDACEGASWERLCTRLSMAAMFPVGPRKFVRSGAVAYADYKAYDCGRLHVCVAEQDNTDNVGKLWVDYEVELFVPQNDTSPPTLAQGSVSGYQIGAAQTVSTGALTTANFSTTAFNPLGITDNGSGSFTLPKGLYEVHAEIISSDTVSETHYLSVALQKNGVNFAFREIGGLTTAAFGELSISLTGYTSSDGNDVIRVVCKVIGASGTLTLAALTSSGLYFKLI